MRTFTVLLARVPTLGDLREKPDLIIPVPLHKKRLRQRGFNQALELARLFFPGEKRRIQPTILLRSRWTTPQTGLDGKHRRRNLAGAFQVRDARRVQGQRILLIDDVLTTGSTVNECARVLRQNGAGNVEVLTLARVFD